MVINNYKILKQIGEGGFAQTYLAEHILTKKYACLKKNLYELDEIDKKLFMDEAMLLWDICHYSLPTLKDFIKFEDSYILIMSFVPGMTLSQIKETYYPSGIPPEHCCWILQRLLNALHYLHFYGVIHGDIKPQNIIVQGKNHNAILVDFGLSMVKPRHYSKCKGYTLAYAAPEQKLAKPPIPETDLYGLGVSICEILGSKTIGEIPRDIPEPIKNFLKKLILHNPLKRPSNACDLISEISDIRQEVFGRRQCADVISLKTE